MLRASRFFIAPLCIAIALAGLAAGAVAGKPNDAGSLVAVFPPWWSASRALAEASRVGDVVNAGAFPFVLIVQSQRPGLEERLRAAGAVLLLNPIGIGGCEPSESQNV
jgi:hypothetical protein